MPDVVVPGAVTGPVPAMVIQVVRLVSPQAPERIVGSHQLIGDLGFHSLALSELGFTLEELFDLDPVTPEVAMRLTTVADIVTLIDEAITADEARLPDPADIQMLCAQYGTSWTKAETDAARWTEGG